MAPSGGGVPIRARLPADVTGAASLQVKAIHFPDIAGAIIDVLQENVALIPNPRNSDSTFFVGYPIPKSLGF